MLLNRVHNILCTAIVVFILIQFSVIFSWDFMNPIQKTFQDFYYTDFVFSDLRDYREIPTDTNVVLVNIGSGRSEIARQIEVLSEYSPCTIALDVFFGRDKSPEEDSALEQALSKAKNLVFACKLENYNEDSDRYDSIYKSMPRFVKYGTSGFANLYIDTSKDFRTARRMLTRVSTNDSSRLMFGLRAAQFFDSNAVGSFLGRGNQLETINFRRNMGKYLTFEREETLMPNDALEAVRGKIVLIGIMGPNTKTPATEDVFFTPMNEKFIGRSYPDMYGVVVHANIISMILDSRYGQSQYINTLPDDWSNVLVIIIIYAIMSLYSYIRHKNEEWYELLSNITTLAGFVLVFVVIVYSLHWFNYEIQMPALFFGIMLSTPIFELYHDSLVPLAQSGFQKVKSMKGGK